MAIKGRRMRERGEAEEKSARRICRPKTGRARDKKLTLSMPDSLFICYKENLNICVRLINWFYMELTLHS